MWVCTRKFLSKKIWGQNTMFDPPGKNFWGSFDPTDPTPLPVVFFVHTYFISRSGRRAHEAHGMADEQSGGVGSDVDGAVIRLPSRHSVPRWRRIHVPWTRLLRILQRPGQCGLVRYRRKCRSGKCRIWKPNGRKISAFGLAGNVLVAKCPFHVYFLRGVYES